MVYDLRHAVRAIARAKGVAAILLLSLGLGTGLNAAVYGVLDALVLRPPPGIDDTAGLVNVYTSEYSGSAAGLSSYPDYASLAASGPFQTVAAIDDSAFENVQTGNAGGAARIAQVTADFFATLRITPHAGRLDLRADDDSPLAVISFELAEQLGGASAIVGTPVTIAERSFVVAGVTPRQFRGLQIGRECDVWTRLTLTSSMRGNRHLAIVARVAPGASRRDVATALARLGHDLAERFPATNRGNAFDRAAPRRFTALPLSRLDPAAAEQTALLGLVIGGASTLLLAAACLNVGGLLLSWSVARRRELAVKMALGAQRSALVRQLLTETVCLSLAGGAIGLLFAYWASQAAPALFMVEQAEMLDTHLNARTFLLTVGIACLAGVVFGVAPAMYGTASPAVTALRADSGALSEDRGGGRLRTVLVSSQVALSTILLLITGLMVISLDRALEGELASTAAPIAVVSIELPGRFHNVTRGTAQRELLMEQVPKLRDVVQVAWSSSLPLDRGQRNRFRIESRASEAIDTREFDTNVVSPGYFDVLSLRLVEGRTFNASDTALSNPVVVVDELLARRHFGAEALGHHLVDTQGRRLEIIGIVRSGRYRTLQQPPQPTVYYPMSQEYLWAGHLIVHTSTDPAKLLGVLRTTAEMTGTGNVVKRAATLEARLSESLSLDRLTTTLIGACGIIALAMSTLGVYGIMMDAVQRRTREIGLRVALGAAPRHIASLVFLEATYPAAVGLVLGTVTAMALGRAAQSFLYGVPPVGLVGFLAAAVGLAAVIVIAAVVPLSRALRIHPNIALRAE
jgi:predicted permease